jgi:hypothetical protein
MRHSPVDEGAFSRQIPPFRGWFTAAAAVNQDYVGLAAFNRTMGTANCKLVVDHAHQIAEHAKEPRLQDLMVVALVPTSDLAALDILYV